MSSLASRSYMANVHSFTKRVQYNNMSLSTGIFLLPPFIHHPIYHSSCTAIDGAARSNAILGKRHSKECVVALAIYASENRDAQEKEVTLEISVHFLSNDSFC